jgi:Ca-activated chloride channel family protein
MRQSIPLLGGLMLYTLFTACVQSDGGSSNTTSNNKSNSATTTEEKSNFLPEEYDAGKLINWYTKPDNSWILQNTPGEIYIYMNIRSGQPPTDQKRIPLNISLVLDRSGSMSGEKIDYAKRAAKFLIDQLSKDDYLSLVNYDDQVEVTSISQKIKNKEVLKHAVDQITDRGSTNLSGGMLEGYAQASSTRKDGYVNRVLLLTDGLANQGITEPLELKRLVEKKYKEAGVALSTFGLGADYNEDLLTLLAESGRANYYFIDSADKIPALFARELKGLLNVVAQNAVAQVNIPEGFECTKVYGYPFEVKNGQVYVRFNDIYANDEKAILIKLKSKIPVTSSLRFNCTLSYIDAQKFNSAKLEKQLDIKVTTRKTDIEKGQDSTVHEMLALFESTEQFDDIMMNVDKGDYATAHNRGTTAIQILHQKDAVYNSPKLKEQAKKMSAYLDNIDSLKTMANEQRKLFQKSSKSLNYEVKKQKSYR